MAQDSEKALFEDFQKKTDQLHEVGDIKAVKTEAQELLALNPAGFNHRLYAAASFIDVAEALHDITCADTGIALVEDLLQTADLAETFFARNLR